MKIFIQHRKIIFHINTILIFITMTLFTTTLSAAEKPEKHPWSVKFELRLASHEYVDGWEKSSLSSGGPIWISPEASINNADVLQAWPEDTGNGYSVCFLLTEEGTLKFARFTKSNTGKYVAIMIDNSVISAPKIIAEITSGRAIIEDRLTEKEARDLAKGIAGH